MENVGVVADANIIRLFFHSMKKKGTLVDFIEIVLDQFGMAYSPEIKYEWESKINKQIFDIWFVHYHSQGKLKEIDLSITFDDNERKTFFNKYGFPRKKDLHYLHCAKNTKIKYIVTKDIDFFEPKKKNCCPKERIRIIDKKQGTFCNFLRKKHRINIGTPHHFCIDNAITEIVIQKNRSRQNQ